MRGSLNGAHVARTGKSEDGAEAGCVASGRERSLQEGLAFDLGQVFSPTTRIVHRPLHSALISGLFSRGSFVG